MELIEELESVRRGVYAGALGYFDVRGGLDLSVVIRTLVVKEGLAHLNVGGGIVADSSPQAEYLESLDKARAPLAALRKALSASSPVEAPASVGGEDSGASVEAAREPIAESGT